jgi:outer membrane receptor for ferric coprogen and ferric-rhodotorulic acid
MLQALNETITTHNKTADYLFSCYFTANYNQTHSRENRIYSFANDLQRSSNQPALLVDYMKSSLTGIYSQTFDPEGIIITTRLIEYENDKTHYGITVSMKLRTLDGIVFDFNTALNQISTTISDVNLIKRSVTLGGAENV